MNINLEARSADEVDRLVKKFGVAIWRKLVPNEITSAFGEPVRQNLLVNTSYVSTQYGVLSTRILPPNIQDACMVPEMKQVFKKMLGDAPLFQGGEIYVSMPAFAPHLWHQDAKTPVPGYHAFVWVAITPCGLDHPGLSFALDNPGKWLGGGRAPEIAATQTEVISPIFEPGDAFFFDIYSLHKTNTHPSTPYSRLAYKLGGRAT